MNTDLQTDIYVDLQTNTRTSEVYKDLQRDTQDCGQIHRQTDKNTDQQVDTQIMRQIYSPPERYVRFPRNKWKVETYTGLRANTQDRQIHRPTDRYTELQTDTHTYYTQIQR